MIFFLLIQQLGCVSSKTLVNGSDIPISPRYNYLIHEKDSKYRIKDVNISDSILSGKIYWEESIHLGTKVHIYISDDHTFNIDPDGNTKIPVNYILKTEIVKINFGKTTLLVIISTLGTMVIYGIITLDAADLVSFN